MFNSKIKSYKTVNDFPPVICFPFQYKPLANLSNF